VSAAARTVAPISLSPFPPLSTLSYLDDLLEAPLQVRKCGRQLAAVGLGKLGARERGLPRRLLQAEPPRKARKRVGRHLARRVEPVLDKGAHHGAAGFLDLFVEGDRVEVTAVVARVELLDLHPDGPGQDAGKAGHGARLDVGAVDFGDVDEGGDGFRRARRLADNVEPARQEPRLDLHQLRVDFADDAVPVVQRQVGGVAVGQDDVAVEVALTGRLDDRRANRGPAPALAQPLVRRDELLQLLQPFVQARVFGGGREVGDRVGVRAPFRDCRLRRVVGCIVVEIRHRSDQRVRVAPARHADLLAGHELERAVGAEMEDGVGSEDFFDKRVVRGEAVVGRGRPGKEQAHGVALVAEGGLGEEKGVWVSARLSTSVPFSLSLSLHLPTWTPMNTLPNCLPKMSSSDPLLLRLPGGLPQFSSSASAYGHRRWYSSTGMR